MTPRKTHTATVSSQVKAASGFDVNCFCMQAGKTARILARRYNASLASLDVTVNEVSLLARMTGSNRSSITDLADQLGFERTTLVRNLRRMEERGMIVKVESTGRAVHYVMTEKGGHILKRAFPIWQKVHGEVAARLEAGRGDEIMKAFKTLRSAI